MKRKSLNSDSEYTSKKSKSNDDAESMVEDEDEINHNNNVNDKVVLLIQVI